MAVLEDAGQPAFVRNDFRVAFCRGTTVRPYEQFVAEHYGRAALPPAAALVSRPDIASFFASADARDLRIGRNVGFFPRAPFLPT